MRPPQSFYDCNQVLSGKLPVAPELRSRIKAGEKKNKCSSPGKIIKRAGNSTGFVKRPVNWFSLHLRSREEDS